jgi:hypothetical protein
MCLTHRIAIAIDTPLAVTIDMDALACNNKPRMVVLESNWVGIVAPVIEIIGQLRQENVN